MLGISRQVSLDVSLEGPATDANEPKKSVLDFSATGRLMRSDFGIVTRTYVADPILLMIEARFEEAPE